MIIRYGALGLSLGGAVLISIYVLLFKSADELFSFQYMGSLHRQIGFLFICDAFPLIAIFVGAFLGNWRFRQMNALALKVESETEMNQAIRHFTHSLIAGELNTSFKHKGADHTLSESLNKLKDTLSKNREMERQRRLDERQRNWVSQGLAEFGDILRTQAENQESMADATLSALVSYLDANQGAIYINNEEEKQLQMLACFAYDRKKFPDKIIPWGDGLIGAVALEKKGFYTDKLPDGYLSVTSGLGKANPSFLLIEPLIWNNQVFGILEIASFKEIENYKLLFVSRVAENIATTLNTMESKLRTEVLLKETQAQADRLVEQDELMKQNMEALKKTQEEAARNAEIFISFTNTVNHTLMRAEYDTDGRLLYANTRFLKKLGYMGMREVQNKHINSFINEKEKPWFNELWDRLSRGGRHYEGYMKHETKMGQDLWTMATYTCVRRDDGEVEKVLFLAIDSTEQKKQSLDFEGQINAIDRLNAKAVFSPAGKLQISNSLFKGTLKYTDIELEQKNVFDFLGTGEQERFTEIWDKVIRGEPFQGQLKMYSKYEEELWFRATFLSANDMYGEVEKVVFLASELTKEKEMELNSRRSHEHLLRKEEELKMAGLDLKKKLDNSTRLRKEEKESFERDVRQYTHVLNELPHAIVSINNQGFILLFNRASEKLWGLKAKAVLGKQVSILFGQNPGSPLVAHFCDPARSKTTGLHQKKQLILQDGRELEEDIQIIRTDMKEEIHYSLLILSPR